MIMEKRTTTYFTRALQQNYVIYIALISIYINKYIEDIERIHISSEYEVVEHDTTLEIAQEIVDKIIEDVIEKSANAPTPAPETAPVPETETIPAPETEQVPETVLVPEPSDVKEKKTSSVWEYIYQFKLIKMIL